MNFEGFQDLIRRVAVEWYKAAQKDIIEMEMVSVAIFGNLSRIWLLLTPIGDQNFLFGYLSFLATFLATF